MCLMEMVGGGVERPQQTSYVLFSIRPSASILCSTGCAAFLYSLPRFLFFFFHLEVGGAQVYVRDQPNDRLSLFSASGMDRQDEANGRRPVLRRIYLFTETGVGGEKKKQDEEFCISWLNFNNLCVSVYVRSFVRSVIRTYVRTYARLQDESRAREI